MVKRIKNASLIFFSISFLILNSYDLYEPGVREMQKHNDCASDYDIIDESDVIELTDKIRQDKAHSLRNLYR